MVLQMNGKLGANMHQPNMLSSSYQILQHGLLYLSPWLPEVVPRGKQWD
jgi:hypothetical protein